MIVSAAALCAGGAYAFAVPPFGPRGVVAWPLGLLLLAGVGVTVADGAAFGRVGALGKYSNYQDAVRRSQRYGRR